MSSIIVNEPEKPTKKIFCCGIMTLLVILTTIFSLITYTKETVLLNPMVEVYQSEPDFSLYTMDPYNKSRV